MTSGMPRIFDYPGFFLTLEGGEGSGKSTLASRLVDALTAKRVDAVRTREPGSGPVGAVLRDLLLNSQVPLQPRTEALLMAADRAQHVGDVILPALTRGQVVVCDRHMDSSVAYQGAGRNLGEADVRRVSLFASDRLVPNMTVLLDVVPEVGLARRGHAGEVNRIDAETLEFHRAVRRSYLGAAALEPERFLVVNATDLTPDQVFTRVWAALTQRLTAH